MSLPKRPTAYPQEKQVLDSILASAGAGTYELPTEKAAVQFYQRVQYFRKLVSELGELQYEHLMIRRRANVVIFEPVRLQGTLKTPEGDVIDTSPEIPLPPPIIKTIDNADLSSEAIAAAIADLGLDLDD